MALENPQPANEASGSSQPTTCSTAGPMNPAEQSKRDYDARTRTYAYTTCECGKEFMVMEPFQKLNIACPSCEALFHIADDSCPATIYTRTGAAACMLPFRHKGKCQRDDSYDEQIAGIVKQRRLTEQGADE